MKISDILDVCNGNLVNFPFISSIEGIATQSHRVKRGDLFFALDTKEIENAVSKGAYAIVFDKPTQVSDYEIAWIKVDCVKSAISKFIRYELANNPREIFLVSPLEIDILKKITSYKNINLLDDNSLDNYHKVLSNKNILVSSDKEYLEFISSNYHEIDTVYKTEFSIVSSSTFDITFRYKDKMYDKIKIPKMFSNALFRVLKFLIEKDIDFNLHDIEQLEHFVPQFIDNMFNEREFGKSDRVLIFEPEMEYVQQEIEYLNSECSWAKSVVVVNSSNHTISSDNIYIAKNNKNIIDILKKQSFNFALIVGKDKSAVEKYINQSVIAQPTLFDI